MSELKSSKYTILCVDDNKNNLFTLDALLSSVDGVESVDALSAKEALDVLLTQHVDLILSDVQMPDINGFEFAQMIKSNKKTKDIPIIFVTAVFKSEEFIKYGFELGVVDYITKPIDDNQLINKITLYLKLFNEKNRVAQSEKRLYNIAQSIGDGIYTIDIDGNVTFINKEALNLLGYKSDELIGKNMHNYVHYKNKNNKQILEKDCKVHVAMLHGEKFRNNNERMVKKDGSFLEVSLVSTPLFVDNQITGTVVVFRDKSNEIKITKLENDKMKNQEQIIHSMIDMIESRDSYTAGHTKRVAYYCELIAKQMGYKVEDIELIKKAAWLHDIGKISTPDSVLLKPGQLDDLEYELIQEHLNSGYEMLSKIDEYKPIADIMREHHEKYDGSGYPRGLKADEIKPLGRIMMVADAFDAMTTNRVYKPRKSVEKALEEIESLSAKSYHPEVVTAALVALKDVKIDLDISQLPKTTMEEQRFSYFYRDRLTNLFIPEYLELLLRYYVKSKSVYMYDIKLHNFSAYNEKFGWKRGDEFLIEFAGFLSSLYTKKIIFRVEGDDFMVLSESKIENMQDDVNEFERIQNSFVDCSVSEEYIKDINVKYSNKFVT